MTYEEQGQKLKENRERRYKKNKEAGFHYVKEELPEWGVAVLLVSEGEHHEKIYKVSYRSQHLTRNYYQFAYSQHDIPIAWIEFPRFDNGWH